MQMCVQDFSHNNFTGSIPELTPSYSLYDARCAYLVAAQSSVSLLPTTTKHVTAFCGRTGPMHSSVLTEQCL